MCVTGGKGVEPTFETFGQEFSKVGFTRKETDVYVAIICVSFVCVCAHTAHIYIYNTCIYIREKCEIICVSFVCVCAVRKVSSHGEWRAHIEWRAR